MTIPSGSWSDTDGKTRPTTPWLATCPPAQQSAQVGADARQRRNRGSPRIIDASGRANRPASPQHPSLKGLLSVGARACCTSVRCTISSKLGTSPAGALLLLFVHLSSERACQRSARTARLPRSGSLACAPGRRPERERGASPVALLLARAKRNQADASCPGFRAPV